MGSNLITGVKILLRIQCAASYIVRYPGIKPHGVCSRIVDIARLSRSDGVNVESIEVKNLLGKRRDSVPKVGLPPSITHVSIQANSPVVATLK